MTAPLPTGVFNYLELDRVHFGTPAADALHAEAAQRGAQRIVVVTSRSLSRKTDAVTAAPDWPVSSPARAGEPTRAASAARVRTRTCSASSAAARAAPAAAWAAS